MIEEGMSTSSQLPSNGDMLVLDTSKPTPLELYSKPVSSEVVVPDSTMYYSAPVRLMESDYGQTQQSNPTSQDLVQQVRKGRLILVPLMMM